MKSLAQPAPAPAATLSRATVTAADLLGVSQAELAPILGLSPATISRMANGQYLLNPSSKEWQLAALFVRLFRSLDSLTGGNDAHSRAWLRSPNHDLEAIPATLLADVSGLVRVVQYLDACRALG